MLLGNIPVTVRITVQCSGTKGQHRAIFIPAGNDSKRAP